MKIKNPKLTITTEQTFDFLDILDNGYIVNAEGLTGTFEVVVSRDADDNAFYVNLNGEYVIENAVNCTYDEGSIIITDPTKDASCTVRGI